ncbi:MAG TPA: hypothetical protein VFV35_03405, partial [Acidimicrobiales bacterium]|nr:hypothetical protein [Acidimicrobiales bacterium]
DRRELTTGRGRRFHAMTASFADRPPPDPEAFLRALDDWRAGDATPGTTLQALKRAGLDELLAHNAEPGSALLAAWDEWERGRAMPGPTLDALDAAGLADLLRRVRDTQREVFGDP